MTRETAARIPVTAGALLLAACAAWNPGPALRSESPPIDPASDTPTRQTRHVSRAELHAMRQRGIEAYERGEFETAISTLGRVLEIDPLNGETLFYLGVSYEYLDDIDAALEAYRQYTRLSGIDRRFRRKMLGRIEALNRVRFERYAATLVANEQDLPAEPSGGLAVLRFTGEGENAGPLSLGLSELLTTDLSKARALTVVERLRVEAILAELRLARSAYVDPSTAPRLGRLVGAGRLVSGTVVELPGGSIRVDAYVVDVGEGSVEGPSTLSGSLGGFFDLEKDLAFRILDDLDVRLTIEEEDAIKEVPTRNFLAYMSYCRGLALESRGDYRQALGEFDRAASLDTRFEAAGIKAESLKDALAGAGTSGAAGADALARSYAETATRDEMLIEELARGWGVVGFFPTPLGLDPSGPRATRPGPARTSADLVIPLPRRQ